MANFNIASQYPPQWLITNPDQNWRRDFLQWKICTKIAVEVLSWKERKGKDKKDFNHCWKQISRQKCKIPAYTCRYSWHETKTMCNWSTHFEHSPLTLTIEVGRPWILLGILNTVSYLTQRQSTLNRQIIKYQLLLTTFVNKTLIFADSAKHGSVKMTPLLMTNYVHLSIIFCLLTTHCQIITC